MTVFYSNFQSSLGAILLNSDGQFLTGLYTGKVGEEGAAAPKKDWVLADHLDIFAATKEQLSAYFDNHRTTFDVPLKMQGTAFQKIVWEQLLLIPYGQSISYGELAKRIKNPKAVRAVGAANGRNPISIIVPCHRVIGANGTLTGYGGGLPRKEFLLDLEQKTMIPYDPTSLLGLSHA
jgi:methylated-DNA-[protein]-cysteine S-methyltransferase